MLKSCIVSQLDLPGFEKRDHANQRFHPAPVVFQCTFKLSADVFELEEPAGTGIEVVQELLDRILGALLGQR